MSRRDRKITINASKSQGIPPLLIYYSPALTTGVTAKGTGRKQKWRWRKKRDVHPTPRRTDFPPSPSRSPPTARSRVSSSEVEEGWEGVWARCDAASIENRIRVWGWVAMLWR
jgi:hypothetical protein